MQLTSKFIDECLNAHNEFRSLHDSPALVIDQELNKYAQERAEHFGKKENVVKKRDAPYGENICVTSGFVEPKATIEAWYNQKKYYNFSEEYPLNFSKVKNFTQLVWKDTRRLGVGLAESGYGKVFLVCCYEPSGNVHGEFLSNVRESSKELIRRRMILTDLLRVITDNVSNFTRLHRSLSLHGNRTESPRITISADRSC
ncbi:Golgi-associated plant pathogenesis-related protein 1-like [Prorops nasuta]|uniref:Golgi-associated plant pathogenesis-related protein 1-like n=1 Tax=Prorops nasuta TaxID=863751 RepID=UPI0034CF219A